MDDLISRQKLKDALYHEAFEKDSNDQKWDSGCWIRYRMFERITDAQPSAEKKAKILNANPVGECSACGWLIDYRDGFNYCPGCGARLILIIARGAVQEWRKEKDGSDQQTGSD